LAILLTINLHLPFFSGGKYQQMRVAIFTLIFSVIGCSAAMAASFCIVGMGIPPQCLYEDTASCMGAATSPNTFCGVNPEARLYYYGSSRYCAVQSSRIAQCIFNDISQCYESVFEDRAVCLDREERSDDINPFRYDLRVGN
jgi:hypothetical protein